MEKNGLALSKEQANIYIQKILPNKIVGWAGDVHASELKISIHFNGVELGTLTLYPEMCPFPETLEGVEGCWFELQVSQGKLLQAFLQDKERVFAGTVNGADAHVIANEKILEIEDWIGRIDLLESVRGMDFLYILPLYERDILPKASMNFLLYSYEQLDNFNLLNEKRDIVEKILSELLRRENLSKEESELLNEFLSKNSNFLKHLIQKICSSKNEPLKRMVLWRVFQSSFEVQGYYQKSCHSCGEEIPLLLRRKMEEFSKEREKFKIFKGGKEGILSWWKTLSPLDRKRSLFDGINLLVAGHHYEALSEMDLSFQELHEAIGEERKNYNFRTLLEISLHRRGYWDSYLLLSYLVSSGLHPKDVLDLMQVFLQYISEHLLEIEYVDMHLIWWIYYAYFTPNYSMYQRKIDHTMKMLHSIIEHKYLWENHYTKKIRMEYLICLISSGSSELADYYKEQMNHYLLDREVRIEIEKMDWEQIPDPLISAWIKEVEAQRHRLFQYLDRPGTIWQEELLTLLETIEYLSPQKVSEMKFSMAMNRFNRNKNFDEANMWRVVKDGGDYERYLAASHVASEYVLENYERKIIAHTTKNPKHSSNNHYYKMALRSRKAEVSKREKFREKLTKAIMDAPVDGEEKERLVRLFFSEWTWDHIHSLETEKWKRSHMSLQEKLESISSISQYRILFDLFLELSKKDEDEFLDFHTIRVGMSDRIEKVRKLFRDEQFVKVSSIKDALRQSLLYPYTLVMVYSCQAYKDTRQETIRKSWLKRAHDLGIDVLFVVGGGKESGTEGDLLYLDVSDNYEDLPKKTVEMFRYVSEHFFYDRYLKIDDDCFLNVDAFFSDDCIFDHEYYGRVLHRQPGDMDRVWHQKKSRTKEAQEAMDLSPEPSSYADGSTGYLLGASACKELVQAHDLLKNRMLVEHSYMEDKLVGDILATRGIYPEECNFTSLIHRTVGKDIQATFWEYNVYPRSGNGMKIFHTESGEELEKCWKNYFQKSSNKEKGIYRSNLPLNGFRGYRPGEEWKQKAIVEELDVNREKIEKARHLALVVCRDEFSYLPALLKHHRQIGVDHFLYIDNGSEDGSIDYMMDQKDVSVFVSTQNYKEYRYGVDWMEAVLTHYGVGKWILVIDADEHFVYDGYESRKIEELTKYAESKGFDAFLAPMIDMYPKDPLQNSPLPPADYEKSFRYFDCLDTMVQIDFYGPFSNTQAYGEGLRSRIFGSYHKVPTLSYLNQKYCLFRYTPMQKFTEGLHFMNGGKVADIRPALLHFKYHATFAKKVRRQIELGQHWNNSIEYRRYMEILEENPNLTMYDPKYSLEMENSKTLWEAGYIDPIPEVSCD